MRRSVSRQKLEEFMKELGNRVTTAGTLYITGGSTALLLGMRDQTIDIDIKLDPEPRGAFEAIAELKESLGVNVELASPDQFIPPLPGWADRSRPIMSVGKLDFKHYDLYAQALAKIERGHDTDLADAESFLARGLIAAGELKRLYEAIRPQLIRYPALDPRAFQRKVEAFLQAHADDHPHEPLQGEDLAGLPGGELVLSGLEALRNAETTETALLVLIAAPRLRRLGLQVPQREDIPRPYEHQLYSLLEQRYGPDAHSRYNSLIRRIVSFSHSVEQRQAMTDPGR